jgi:hypothetical protein
MVAYPDDDRIACRQSELEAFANKDHVRLQIDRSCVF